MKLFLPAFVLACTSLSVASVPAFSQENSPALPVRRAPAPVVPIGAISVPGTSTVNSFRSWDGIVVDPYLQIGALSSRSSKAITLFDAFNDQPIGETAPVFTGTGKNVNNSGPNGLVIAGTQIWAGDYPSSIHVFDLSRSITAPPQIAFINTGGTSRVDAFDYDPKNKTIIASNSDTAPDPAFVTLLSTETLRITGKIVFDGTNGTPDGSIGGIGGVLYDSRINKFLVSLSQVGTDETKGAVVALDPDTGAVTQVISGIDNCQPSSLVQGPGDNVLIGCDPGFPVSDPVAFAPRTYVINARTGAITANITQVGGADLVAYDPSNHLYYTASRDFFTDPKAAAATPVLGVIDAVTNKWIENVPTAPNAHSVAVNPFNNHIYLPISNPNALCNGLPGCIAVFGTANTEKPE